MNSYYYVCFMFQFYHSSSFTSCINQPERERERVTRVWAVREHSAAITCNRCICMLMVMLFLISLQKNNMNLTKLSSPTSIAVYRKPCHFPLAIHFLVFVAVWYNYISLKSLLLNVTSCSSIRHPYSVLNQGRRYYDNQSFFNRLRFCFAFSVAFTWCLSLLSLSGDIHPNPGPIVSESSSTSTDSVSSVSVDLTKYFSLTHYNVQSILHKIDLLGAELSEFDILAFTETWLNNSINPDDLIIPSYKPPERKDRITDSHGGVAIYIKGNIHHIRRHDLELNHLEALWVEINLNNNKILIGVFYRPPNSGVLYQNLIEDSINLAIDTGIKNIIITGDFNYNMLVPNTERKVKDMCLQFSLTQLITEPTNYTEISNSLIDLILVNNHSSVVDSGVANPFLDQPERFHCPVYIILNFRKPQIKSFNRQIWLFNQGHYDTLRQACLRTDWNDCRSNDINVYANLFTQKLLYLAEQNIPRKTVRIRPNEPPWITNIIKHKIRQRKRIYRKAKLQQTQYYWSKFKTLRNEIVNMIRNAKIAYYNKLACNIKNDRTKTKNWWKTLKSFISKSNPSTIPPLTQNGIVYTDAYDKANLLNEYFTKQTILDDVGTNVPCIHSDPVHRLSSIHLSPPEVQTVLKSLSVDKAAGPDLVNNKILRELSYELSLPLCDLFNKSLSSGVFPQIWKDANVCPVYKKGDPSSAGNYRPISLLSTIGKVFERLVFNYLFNLLHDNNFLTPVQSGFIPGDSTINQLTYLYNSICEAVDHGKEVRCIFFDVSKAFDKVWHKGLLEKLKSAGVTDEMYKWFANYLTNRRQCVTLPGGKSDWSFIHAGVPQGSILGPLMFLIYINDIVLDIQSNINLFADDTSLFIIVEDANTSRQILQSDIDSISQWANKWLVTFNPTKSEALTFSRKLNKPIHPSFIHA